MERICSVPGCGGKHEAKGFCMTHYSRLLRGDDIAAPVRRVGVRRECSIDGCENRGVTKGLCRTHDYRARRGLALNEPVRKRQSGVSCAFLGCGRPAVSRGLCSGHRRQSELYGDMRPIGRGRRRGCELETCAISGCDRVQYSSAMCGRHSARAARYGLSVIQLQALLLVDECAICHEEVTESSGAIDHDHSCCAGQKTCGKCIIGVICLRCNAGIGYFANHPGVMMNAIDYLLRTRPL